MDLTAACSHDAIAYGKFNHKRFIALAQMHKGLEADKKQKVSNAAEGAF